MRRVFCEAVTAENVDGSEDNDAPTLPTSEKSQPEQKSKNKAGKKRKQPKSTSADKMENFMEKFFEIQQESERRFLESEERRSKQEAEQEEERRWFEAEQDDKPEKTFSCVFYKPFHKAPVAAKIKVNTQFRYSFFNCL